MESLRHDVRQALRLMAAHRTFSAAVLLTLALGVGANTAMFSVVYGVLLRPLPYPESEQLMRVFEEHPGGTPQVTDAVLTDFTLNAWAPRMKTLEGVATASRGIFAIGREDPVTVDGGFVSPSLFELLRVQPIAGRFFRQDDAVEGADPVVILGYGLWQERYGASPEAIGQTLFIGGRSHLVIGIAPSGFAFRAPTALSGYRAGFRRSPPMRHSSACARCARSPACGPV